jgi:hypothetical protein
MSKTDATVEPFRIAAPDQVLERLRHRIGSYPWDAAADDAVGWRYGPATSHAWLRWPARNDHLPHARRGFRYENL